MSCPRLFDYVYNQRLVLIEEGNALAMGSAVHHGIEHRDPNKAVEYLEELEVFATDSIETTKSIVYAMVEGYLKLYGDKVIIFDRELELLVPMGDGDEFTGYIDEVEAEFYTEEDEEAFRELLEEAEEDEVKLTAKDVYDLDGSVFISDIKTTSQFGDPSSYKDQLLKYYYGYIKTGFRVDGLKVRVIKKPGIRQTKKESVQDYRERVIAEYRDHPEKYFKEVELSFNEAEIVDAMMDFKSGCQMIKAAKALGLYPKNLNNCSMWGGCSHAPLCNGEPDAIELYKRRDGYLSLEEKLEIQTERVDELEEVVYEEE